MEIMEPVKIELGTRIMCEDREFIVASYSLTRDHAGYLLRFEAQDPLISLSRQMQEEKMRQDRQTLIDSQQRAIKLLERQVEEMDQGEEWKREKDGDSD